MSDGPNPDHSLTLPARHRDRPGRAARTAIASATVGPTWKGTASSDEALTGISLPLREMAGGIAHDFRNLLAVIASALDLAERHRGDHDRVDSYLAGARGAADRAAALASRLLALARPAPPTLRADSLSRLVRDSLPFLTYAAGPRIRLKLELCDELACCAVDPARFGAALLNLVANARDAMPGGGEIVISTATDHSDTAGVGFVRVRVSDTGGGIAPEVEARMFEPWFTTKSTAGTGLGLPQVLRLMTEVGGRLSVATSSAGTCIDLYFPVIMDANGVTADLRASPLRRLTPRLPRPGHQAEAVL